MGNMDYHLDDIRNLSSLVTNRLFPLLVHAKRIPIVGYFTIALLSLKDVNSLEILFVAPTLFSQWNDHVEVSPSVPRLKHA